MPLIAGESKPARSRTRTSIAVLDMRIENDEASSNAGVPAQEIHPH
jgi:hypothetical protein